MNPATFANLLPIAALYIAQVGEGQVALTTYGPIGIICLFLMIKDERKEKAAEKREENLRAEFGKMLEGQNKLVHEFKGLNRSLLYMTATHSPSASMREVAQRELDRKMAQDERRD